RRRQEKEMQRKSAGRRHKLPGKLTDCTSTAQEGAELFIVEGDSAGGTAKVARDRVTQAILPLRGKILNVASAGKDKLAQNQQLKETPMDPRKRTLLRVVLVADDREDTADSVERLMGAKAEARFAFIQEKAEFADEEILDV